MEINLTLTDKGYTHQTAATMRFTIATNAEVVSKKRTKVTLSPKRKNRLIVLCSTFAKYF